MDNFKFLIFGVIIFFKYSASSLEIGKLPQLNDDTITDQFMVMRCPTLKELNGCTCDSDFILECDGKDISQLRNVYVNEIIIKNTKSKNIPFKLINPSQKGLKITLQNNELLDNITTLFTIDLNSIKLINNSQLITEEILQSIPKSVEHIHIEKSKINSLTQNLGFENLTTLILPMNGIKSISSNIFGSLRKINIIDLSFNNISTIGLDSLKFNNEAELEIFLNSNEINSESLNASNLMASNPKKLKFILHLENNIIESFPETFGGFVKNHIQVFFDGNPITCSNYSNIDWAIKPSKDISRKYLLNVFCEDYSMNLFDITNFKNQPPTKVPVLFTTDHTLTNGTLKITINEGNFTRKSESYIAVCLNSESISVKDTENCKLCGSSLDANHTHHIGYSGVCDFGSTLYPDDTLLVFGASSVKTSKISAENILGVAMRTIDEAVNDPKITFDNNQYIIVTIEFL